MPFQFYQLEERPAATDTLSILLYGGAKTGKTFFAGTTGDRTLYIDTGRGLLTLKSPKFKEMLKGNFNPIVAEVREDTNEERLVTVPKAFDEVCDAIDEGLEKFPEKFDTVVLDDATALRKFAIHKALSINLEEKRSQTATKKRRVVLPAIQDFGTEMAYVEWFMYQYDEILRKAGKHFIVLAHERHIFAKKDKVGDPDVVQMTRPGFTGKTFPDDIMAIFDFVWHTEKVGSGNNATYRIRTSGDENTRGGSRFGGLFSDVEPNPNFQKMLQRIKAYSDGKQSTK